MYNKFRTVLFVSLALISLSITVIADDVELKDIAPVVIRTFPIAGASMVDPATTKIYVTFSHKMADKSWSFVMQDQATFPKLNGSPQYDKEQRTCTLNVSLEPEKTYIIWINSAKFANFKGENGKIAIPYLLSFKTAGQAFTNKKRDATKAAETWLKLLNSAKFAASWKEASPYFQKQVAEEQWIKQITDKYSKGGKVKARKLISSNYAKSLPNLPEGEYFILRFTTSFEQKPNSTETLLIMRTSDGTWKIAGYFIK